MHFLNQLYHQKIPTQKNLLTLKSSKILKFFLIAILLFLKTECLFNLPFNLSFLNLLRKQKEVKFFFHFLTKGHSN